MQPLPVTSQTVLGAVFSAINRSNFAISRHKWSMLAKLDNGASEFESISVTECLL